MAHGLVGNEKIHRFGLEAAGSESLGPLGSLQPIAWRHWKLMQAGKMAVQRMKFLSRADPAQKLKENRRGDGGLILTEKLCDTLSDFRDDSRRKVKDPGRGIDQNQTHC